MVRDDQQRGNRDDQLGAGEGFGDHAAAGNALHGPFMLTGGANGQGMRHSRAKFTLLGVRIDWLGIGGFANAVRIDNDSFVVADWMIVFFCILISAASWLPWRFSLRTLLIATTLFAVVLGLVVWAMRG